MKTKKLNRTIFIRDNLDVLRTLQDNSVDLIYLDPPFNSNKNYGAPIGSREAGFHFKDMWYLSDTDEAWWGELSDKYPDLYEIIHAVGCVNGNKDKSYLIYMTMRLLEMHRILKDTGSIYFHCDQTMSHSLKLVMDGIFGRKNFLNEIFWKRRTNSVKALSKKFSTNSETIFFYSKKYKRHFFQTQYKDYPKEYYNRFKYEDENGKYRWQVMATYSDERLKKLKSQNKLRFSKTAKYPEFKQYMKDLKGRPIENIWQDIDMINAMGRERTGYSTQKPLALLERIIEASCPEDGLVLDPFCGCATACIAAEKLERKWIGIDLSPLAEKLVKKRLVNELGLTSQLVNIRKDLPIKNALKPSKDIKHVLYGKQEGYCSGCNIHFQIVNLTIDHVIPRSKGGQDTDKNLQLLCGHCNSVKGNREMEYLLANLHQEASVKEGEFQKQRIKKVRKQKPKDKKSKRLKSRRNKS